MTVTIELVDPEGQLLAEIADRRLTRDDVAATYALALGAREGVVDWSKINHAIIERWSMSALRYVKEKAWRLRRAA